MQQPHFNKILPINSYHLNKKIQKGALVIDTRFIASIFENGSIPNAIFIGIQGNMEGWASVLIEDKSTEIYLIIEENIAIDDVFIRFQKAGFTHIKGYLEGGITAWIHEKFEIEPYNKINPPDFIQEFNSINPQTIIDVRTQKEFQNQHINGSQNIPLANLLNNLRQLESDKHYYMVCQGGYRSIIAASILKRNAIHNTTDIYGGLKNFP